MNELCRRYQESYGGPEMPEELIRHGEECEACREFAQCQQALRQVMPRWKTPPFSADFALSVMSRLAEEDAKPRTFMDLLRELLHVRLTIPAPVGALASMLLMFSVALNFAFWLAGQNLAGQNLGQNADVHVAENYGADSFLNHPASSTPAAVTAAHGNSAQMIDGSLIIPREYLGAGAFLLVPIFEPSLPVQEKQAGADREADSHRDI
ncbi:MAG: hypothetical protein JXR73_08815 [Candidatus Omnitrophica bacterium]|nr:hypothetical protein [Candidatus Omnitrophota bacterium]